MATAEELAARLPPRLGRWAHELAEAEATTGVDAWLLAAVMDRESRGGDALTPPGPRGTGDFGRVGHKSFRDKAKGELGHGRGLMQIDDRTHMAFLAQTLRDGTPAWQDPRANILYGAQLLATLLRTYRGSEARALCAYNAGGRGVERAMARVTRSATSGEVVAALDAVTSGGDYVTWVLQRRELLRSGALQPPPPRVA